MAVADKIKSILDFLTGTGYEGPDGEDSIYKDMMKEGDEYPVEDNLARTPLWGNKESNNQSAKVVSHPNYRGYEVIVSEPRSYEDSIGLIKHLKDRKTVIVDLHLLDKEQGTRIVDFLCGATQALEGNQQKIGDSVFIFTPVNVNLSSESQKSKLIRDALWNQPQA